MWKDDSKMDFKDIDYKGVEWIYVTEDKGQWLAAIRLVVILQVP
jgi:hypothetical protein